MPCIVPLYGQYIRSDEVRAKACAACGHPKDYINLSVSGKVGREIRQCHCGVENEAPAALREWRRVKRSLAQAGRLTGAAGEAENPRREGKE